MEPLHNSIQEYIKSGNYYTDARAWYRSKYIHPFSHRSFIFMFSVIIFILFLGIVMNIHSLLPLVVQIKYFVNANASSNKVAQILPANGIENDPATSIADIMIKNYVLKREGYNYDNLKKQFVFVKNNSTRIVFRKFYNFMNIDNPSSPVMLYQKSINRTPSIILTKYPSPNVAIVTFNSKAQDSSGNKIEDKVWQATIGYEIDKIDSNLPNNTRFNFTITDYQLKMLKDKKTNTI